MIGYKAPHDSVGLSARHASGLRLTLCMRHPSGVTWVPTCGGASFVWVSYLDKVLGRGLTPHVSVVQPEKIW